MRTFHSNISSITSTLVLLLASMQHGFALTINPDAFPFGEVQLATSKQYCFPALSRQGSLGQTSQIGYTLTPATSEHYGQPVDVFVGFRLRSQPEKLWLLHTPNYAYEVEAVEYSPGNTPTSYHSYQSPVTLDIMNSLTIFSSTLPTDLTSLATSSNKGEILVGYGLHANAESTVSDSFQEMIDSGRFSVVWEAGENTGIAEVCIEYSKIRITPDQSGYP